MTRRDTTFSLNNSMNENDNRLKSEYVLLERKYDRLLQKEKRLQVFYHTSLIILNLFYILIFNDY